MSTKNVKIVKYQTMSKFSKVIKIVNIYQIGWSKRPSLSKYPSFKFGVIFEIWDIFGNLQHVLKIGLFLDLGYFLKCGTWEIFSN